LALRKEVARAQALEEEAEYDKAIEIYKKVAGNTEFPMKDVEDHLKKLEEEWAPKSPEHADARKFVYEVWPKLDTEGLESGIAKAVDHLKALQGVHDYRTARKLLRAIGEHASRLSKEQSQLSSASIEDESKIRTIQKAAEGLQKLNDEALKL